MVRENWSVALREQHRLRVFQNRVLVEKCGVVDGRETVTGGLETTEY
jgi:hypothetical protein